MYSHILTVLADSSKSTAELANDPDLQISKYDDGDALDAPIIMEKASSDKAEKLKASWSRCVNDKSIENETVDTFATTDKIQSLCINDRRRGQELLRR